MDIVNNPLKYKGLAHDKEERKNLGLLGLLPVAIRPLQLQVELIMNNLRDCETNFRRYIFLRDLQDTNECLFYRVLNRNIEETIPYIYTPTVGEACAKFSRIFKKPRGVFITLDDLKNIEDIFDNWPEKNIKGIVVTDGGRILGLGDLGANGMGIPIGKISLYTVVAGIPPSILLPVTLDVGTDNEELLNDPFYIGLKQNRAEGKIYDNFVDEFMKVVAEKYGKSCVVQFEDFGLNNAFRFLERYKNQYCIFNDDIQGTASVVVAGILCSLKIMSTELTQHTFLFHGAGQAALGIATLLIYLLEEEGLSSKDAYDKIWLIDSTGLIVKKKASNELNGLKKMYAKNHPHLTDLSDIVKDVKPTVLIGASAQAGIFTEKVLKTMSKTCKQPVIFALSNPTVKAECTAEQAYTFTEGRCIFASGSAFPPLSYKGRDIYPSQSNNVYIFPGIALALIACEVEILDEKIFVVAAKALAEQVTTENLSEGRIYPPLSEIKNVSLKIATKVAGYLFDEGQATYSPRPKDLGSFLTSKQYICDYDGQEANQS